VSPSHYQLSFTAKQAMFFFVLCLFALGLSFFFGLMTGLSGRPKASGSPVSGAATPAALSRSAAEPTADQEKVVSPVAGESEHAVGPGEPTAEPTAPSVLRAFEDRAEAPTPTAVPAAVKSPAPGRTAPSGGNVWVQVTSLTSREEADALVKRLSRAGYRAHVAPVQTASNKLFRVRVGPYRSEEEAQRAAERLRRRERFPHPWIVREGQ